MESQPCRTRILLTTPRLLRGLVEQLLGGPSVTIASCHVPAAPGEVCAAASAWRGPVGLCLFVLLGVWDFGDTHPPAMPREESRFGCCPLGFAAGPRRLLNLLFTAGKWGGRRAFLGVEPGCCSPLLPKKKSAFPLCPFPGSLGSGRLSLGAPSVA